MTKNIKVVDINGKSYGETYAKRAKGLVKCGRARFVDTETICLACPPEEILEDKNMSENMTPETVMTVNDILNKVHEMIKDTGYLNEVCRDIVNIQLSVNNDNGVVEKTEALAEIVKARETTNQQAISLYHHLVDTLTVKNDESVSKLTQIALAMKALNKDEYDEDVWGTILTGFLNQMQHC